MNQRLLAVGVLVAALAPFCRVPERDTEIDRARHDSKAVHGDVTAHNFNVSRTPRVASREMANRPQDLFTVTE